MQDYRIAVMIPDVERRKKTLGPLHFFAGCVILFFAATLLHVLPGSHPTYWVATTLVTAWIILFSLVGRRMFPRDYPVASRSMRWVESGLCLVLALRVFSMHEPFLLSVLICCWCVAFAFMAWTERTLFEPVHIRILSRGIGVPRPGGTRWITWDEIKGVALRPDFFTILLPRNRYIQFEVDQLLLDDDIQEINEFCSAMLKQNTPI